MEQVAIRSNLRVLHLQKEAREGRRIHYKEIAKVSGVAESTISSYMKERVQLFSADTIEKLCNFYGCKPGDLIIIEGDRITA